MAFNFNKRKKCRGLDRLTSKTKDYRKRRKNNEVSHLLPLTCTVTNIHGRSTDALITVRVEGANEFPPKFDKSIFFFDTFDYVDSNKVIGKVIASDADSGNDGILRYYLVSNHTGWEIKRGTGEIIQLKDQGGNRRKRSASEEVPSKRSSESSGTFHNVLLKVEVTDSPLDDSTKLSATATVEISVSPYEANNSQIILIGSAAGGGILLILLLVCIIFFVVKRRKSRSGSKELTYVNPTAVTKEGRNITADGGYHSSDMEKQQIVLADISGYSEKARVNGLHNAYSKDELLGTGYKETPIYDSVDAAYHVTPAGPPPGYLNVRDKLVPHKMSVSTVLSDIRNDVQISAIPHRLTGSMAHSNSYESVHVFGSEGGGEGDAAIDAHSLFNKLSEIDDDISVINKSAHFLGDQDSAFSSLGSSNGEITTPYHTEYLADWKPAFQSVGTICEGMLRNKQFAYRSNRSTATSRDNSVENISPNQNAGLVSRVMQPTNEQAGEDCSANEQAASSCGRSREGSAESIATKPVSSHGTQSPAQSFSSTNL